MDDGGPARITQDDLDGLNRRALLRSGQLVRQVGQALLVVGLLLMIGWIWQVVRFQQLITDSSGAFTNGGSVDIEFGLTDIPWTQRVDAVAASLGLLGFAAVTFGLGLAVRFYAELMTVRQGGDITPWSLGDAIDDGRTHDE